MGVDVEKSYKPTYNIPDKAKKALKAIVETIKEKDIKKVILAPDEDREGEAIAYHLKWYIKSKFPKMKFERITFHEITKSAIQKALKNPRQIDEDLFNAQQARRVLDRLVGYTLSPLLWKKIRYGLSAGRVQSVALRLIVEREREREAFKQEEYWTIQSRMSKKEVEPKNVKDILTDPELFSADLSEVDGKKLKKLDIKNEKEATKIKKDLEKAEFVIEKIEKRETKKKPAPPFRTSTLQREAANKLGYSAKQTMMIAQQLYEGIKLEKGGTGLITYMRTDSLNIAESALKGANTVIKSEFGKEYATESPRRFTKKAKGAQEAHEAVRPTFPKKTPQSIKKYLNDKQFKLYSLIWNKFIASQMKEAIFDKAKVKIKADKYALIANGSVLKFPGFLKVYGQNFKIEEKTLPKGLAEGEKLNMHATFADQHFTQPPARYNDASLIKTLEEHGIGRPSTYAPTLSTITTRGYVEKDEAKQYVPQDIGFLVNDLMVDNFSNIVDYAFTAGMENSLDEVAVGKKDWVKIIDNFYKPFAKELKEKGDKIKKYEKKMEEKCPECGKTLVEKFGRFGKFYACSGYPECKYTRDPNQEKLDEMNKEMGDVKCEKCGSPMEVKRGRWGAF